MRIAPVAIALALLSAPALAAEPSSPGEAAHPAVVDWVRGHAVPLKTVEAGQGLEDMEPLREIVGDARVVALGEATHGSREFFQLKHRMLEFLVERMGFTVFAIEANWPESSSLDEYVVTGAGDPAAGLADLYLWTWQTREVLALVEWMRAWNAEASHPRKLRFYGGLSASYSF